MTSIHNLQSTIDNPTCPAFSYCCTLLDRLSLPTGSWRVISVHRHACNLLAEDDKLIALVSPAHGNGPFHIVVPAAALTGLRVGDLAEFRDDGLVFSHQAIALTQAEAWSSALTALPHEYTLTALNFLFQEIKHLSAPVATVFADVPGMAAYALAGIEALTSGVQTANLALIAKGTHWLAGLGPGLTPAGDDVLVGFLAGLYLWAEQRWAGQMLEEITCRIAQVATGRTTRLSAAWLCHAARGEFGEPWHNLAEALQRGQRTAIHQAAQRILATGVTSGHAAMMGFVHALTLRPDERQI